MISDDEMMTSLVEMQFACNDKKRKLQVGDHFLIILQGIHDANFVNEKKNIALTKYSKKIVKSQMETL